MTKLDIQMKYHDIIAHAETATRKQIVDCQDEIMDALDVKRNEGIDILNKEHKTLRTFSDNLATEAFLVISAYRDKDHPAHDFAVAYIDAVCNRIDCMEGKA